MSFEVIFITEKTRLAYFEQIRGKVYIQNKLIYIYYIYNPETQNTEKGHDLQQRRK